MWASLCKSLPGEPIIEFDVDYDDSPSLDAWSSCLTDFTFFLKEGKEGYHTEFCSQSGYQILEQGVSRIATLDPNTAPLLCCLVVGGAENELADKIYSSMMEYAQQKGGRGQCLASWCMYVIS